MRSNAVYFFGGILGQIGWSLKSKKKYLDEIQYNSFGTTFSKNNFVTTFNYVEENGVIGSTNILENATTFNFDEQNFITFRTERTEK